MTTDRQPDTQPQANGQSDFPFAGLKDPADKSTPNTEQGRLSEARESYAGRLLTDPQFDEAIAITHILEREIYRSGAFKDKLRDYAYAMARSENMDARKLEGSLRDLFRERTGRTMNQMREDLKAREERPTEGNQNKALLAAHAIEVRMAEGDKITFNRATAELAQSLADEFGVTDIHAKSMMMDAFKAGQGEEGISWRDWGETLDQQFYRPQIEAEKEARAQAKEQQLDGTAPVQSIRRR